MSRKYVVDYDDVVVLVGTGANGTYFANAELKMVLLVLFPK